ncbi:MAG TPA: hypothetical protein PKC14_00200 [Candidatus Absconditabacterales bacterium]|nr:hypothetical protein [Candidatus Absconditabacterales bacterium]
MKQKIFLGISLVFLVLFGFETFSAFMANHTYYNTMFADGTNWSTLLMVLVAAFIPTSYLLFSKKIRLDYFALAIYSGILLFGLSWIAIKDQLIGSGLIMFALNSFFIFALGVVFLIGVLSLGSFVLQKVLKLTRVTFETGLLSLGLGIVLFMLVVYFLLLTQLFYPLVSWLIVIAFVGLAFLQKENLLLYSHIVLDKFQTIKTLTLVNGKNLSSMSFFSFSLLLLVVLSFVYYYYGFNLAYIPYPTAWDANHAYMYMPKIWSENHGVLWSEGAQSVPLWYAYIAYWFSLMQPLKSWFWISPDTVAVQMNFLSGLFVLIFGLGLVNEVLRFVVGGKEDLQIESGEPKDYLAMLKDVFFYLGWFLILLWLTSGMGAFLLFIDNKTDLGVLSLSILGMFSGFFALNSLKNNQTDLSFQQDGIKYIIISAVIFAAAALAKQTAFLDVMNFGLLLSYFFLGGFVLVGGALIALGIVSVFQVLTARDFVTPNEGKLFLGLGFLSTIAGVFLGSFKKKLYYIKLLLIWVSVVFLSLLAFKGPQVLYNAYLKGDFSPSTLLKNILLGSTVSQRKPILLVANNVVLDVGHISPVVADDALVSCSLESLKGGTGSLYTGLRTAVGNGTYEDVGRYIGYGQKEFKNVWRSVFFMQGCYSFDSSAQLLCENIGAVNNFDKNVLTTLLPQLNKNSSGYDILKTALSDEKINLFTGKASEEFILQMRDQIKALNDFIAENAVRVTADTVFVPYKLLVPFNVTFNRSLQNLSSYYTDIGFVWLFGMFFVVLGLIYGILQKHRELVGVAGVAFAGWIIWWIIGGGIVWYGIGMIVWTILAVLMFFYYLGLDLKAKDSSSYERLAYYSLLAVFLFWCFVQLSLNLFRIASQGGSGPFVWYRMNQGYKTVFSSGSSYQPQQVVDHLFTSKDVFDLQFPHYNKIIKETQDRKDTDGVLIAGTYLQYFLKNQKKLKQDGMLHWFWEQASDNNTCKTYLRLKDQNLKYLVIDPNIGTVVMGGGNETLFNRFFAKINPVTSRIEDNGAMTILVKLVQDGYIELFSTNNIGAKYAFSLSDDEFASFFPGLSPDETVLVRAQMSVARFFAQSQDLVNRIASIFSYRMQDGKAIGDIADVYGKVIDEAKLQSAAAQFFTDRKQPTLFAQLDTMTEDERFIMIQYLNLYDMMSSPVQDNKARFQQFLQQFLSQSLGGGSQLVVFKLK